MNAWAGLNKAIDRWFTQPEPNAAGRMGLFRIIYSLFYLFYLSSYFSGRLGGIPADYHQRMLLVGAFFDKVGATFFQAIESCLIASIIALMIGWNVRIMTLLVLGLGAVLDASYMAVDSEHATVFLTFYIPFFMVINGRWGETYSLDAFLKAQSKGIQTAPGNDHWRYFLAGKSILVILAALFFSTAFFKVAIGGTWVSYESLIADFVRWQNVEAALNSLPLNHVAPFIAENPAIYKPLRFITVFTEGAFIFALLNRGCRTFFVCLALIFHSVNAIWMAVTFTPALIVYGLFVDWEALRARLNIGKYVRPGLSWLPQLNVRSQRLIWQVATLVLAVLAGLGWNTTNWVRAIFNLGGLLTWHSIWYAVLPCTIFWLIGSSITNGRKKLKAF